MATLRIEQYVVGDQGRVALDRDPIAGQTLTVTSTATAGGARPVVAQSPRFGGTLIQFSTTDSAIYVDIGSAPDPGANPAFLVTPGTPQSRVCSAGELISAVIAGDVPSLGSSPSTPMSTLEPSISTKLRDITVGAANGTVGRYLAVNATIAGDVVIRFSDNTTYTAPVGIGLTLLPFAATAIVTSGTTATATYANLS